MKSDNLYDGEEKVEAGPIECDECCELVEVDATYVCVHCGNNVCEWCSAEHQLLHDSERNRKDLEQ